MNIGLVHELGTVKTCSFDEDQPEYTQLVFDALGIDLAALFAGVPCVQGRGRRYIFRSPVGMPLKPCKLEWPGRDSGVITVFELRCGASQDTLPPSLHPNGKPYQWIAPLPEEPTDHPEPPPPLLDLWLNWKSWKPELQAMCPWQPTQEPTVRPRRFRDVTHSNIIGRYNAAHGVRELLEAHGYQPRGQNRFLPPNSTSGVASVRILDSGRVYSSNGSCPLNDGHAHDAFSIFTILEQGGNVKVAIKAAAMPGIGLAASSERDLESDPAAAGAADQTPPPAGGEPRVKAWPILPPEALYGLAGKVVRLATADCEADPAAVLVTFLTWFGAACGQKDGQTPYVSIGETQHSPRLYAAVVGTSSRSRKGTSKRPVERLMEAAQSPATANDDSALCCSLSECPIIEGLLSSGEGIIYQLRDACDEQDDHGNPIDPGSGDKRLMVIDGELGGVLKVMQREGSIVSTVLRVAWDGGVIEPLTKNNRIRATNPHLCIVGHITADELKALLTSVNLRNGLANRFLWVMARRTRLVSRPRPMPDDAVARLANRIRDALHHATPGPITWSEPALAEWDLLYPELTSERGGAWGYATARAEAQVQRLALIYALLDSSRVITPAHLTAAQALWRYCDASAGYLFAEQEADPLGNRILEELDKAGGELSQTALHGVFGRNLPVARLATALTLLQERGRITQERRQTGGVPAWSGSFILTKKEETSKSAIRAAMIDGPASSDSVRRGIGPERQQ